MLNLFLVSGVSGSGKTTFAQLKARSNDAVIAADDYFTDSGEYRFDAARLMDAHADCIRRAGNIMAAQQGDLYVCNVFATEEHCQPYRELARNHNYRVFDLLMLNTHGSQNVHRVPEHTLKRQSEQVLMRVANALTKALENSQ